VAADGRTATALVADFGTALADVITELRRGRAALLARLNSRQRQSQRSVAAGNYINGG